MFNIKIESGGDMTYLPAAGRNVLLYVLDGEVLVNDKLVLGKQLPVFDILDGEIVISTTSQARFILGSGDPINEPMVSQGPFVMNTTTEILQAMRDYQMGKMGVL